MPFQSAILQGSPRLDNTLAGGPSVKVAPPADDPDAVRRIQKALAALGYPLASSRSNHPAHSIATDRIFSAQCAYDASKIREQ